MTAVRGTDELLGRDAELTEIAAFLDEAADARAALLLEGEAGIGKTALWLAALERARPMGRLVLSARPAGTEATISYAGLVDLLDPVGDDVFAKLAEPQRDALGAALHRRASTGAFEAGTVAVAFLSVVRRLAAAGPVVLAIDDLHAIGGFPMSLPGSWRPRAPGRLCAGRGRDPTGLRDRRVTDPPGPPHVRPRTSTTAATNELGTAACGPAQSGGSAAGSRRTAWASQTTARQTAVIPMRIAPL